MWGQLQQFKQQSAPPGDGYNIPTGHRKQRALDPQTPAHGGLTEAVPSLAPSASVCLGGRPSSAAGKIQHSLLEGSGKDTEP